jgi:hypothetical protein
MKVINGIKFAETNQEFTSSLFQTGGTCSGFIKCLKRRVYLYDASHNPIGIINKYGVAVEAHCLPSGAIAYDCLKPMSIIGKLDHWEKQDIVEELAIKAKGVGNDREYWYK